MKAQAFRLTRDRMKTTAGHCSMVERIGLTSVLDLPSILILPPYRLDVFLDVEFGIQVRSCGAGTGNCSRGGRCEEGVRTRG